MLTPAVARAFSCRLLCAVACVAVLAGCGQEPSKAPQSSGSSSGPAPTTGSSAPATSATSRPPPTSPGPLLSAAELPGFNDEFRWRQGPTRTREPAASFGTCQRFGLLAIGAERVVLRRFTPVDGSAEHDRAAELVATFPDAMTARRAYAVLTSWRARCADRLSSYARSKVGGLHDVTVDGGRGGWYLLTYGPVKGDPDSQFFDAQGMALVGSRIAMVSMLLAGQDYNYAAGQEPMVGAVQRAAQKLG